MKPDTTEALGDAICGIEIATIKSALRDPGVTDPELGDLTYGYEIELAECAVDAIDDERPPLCDDGELCWDQEMLDHPTDFECVEHLALRIGIGIATADRMLTELSHVGCTYVLVDDEDGEAVDVWARIDANTRLPLDPMRLLREHLLCCLDGNDNDRVLAIEAALLSGVHEFAVSLMLDVLDEIRAARDVCAAFATFADKHRDKASIPSAITAATEDTTP